MTPLYFPLLLLILEHSGGDTPSRPYLNQFALQLPPHCTPQSIASRHGLRYMGPILDEFHLFEASHVIKRSTETYEAHSLAQDEDVLWFEQQVDRRRFKRGVPSDPLFEAQWFLNKGAHDGSDMNVLEAWKLGFTGKGVVVTILDDGIQSNHPDLAPNYDPLASADINDNDDDPTPRDDGNNKHGTRCAGEVAAVAYNSVCGAGVAYNASIGGVRMLDGIVNDAVEARALSLRPQHVHVYSASWGPEDDGKTVDGPGRLAKEAFSAGILKGRGGKGSIFVWASGNGGRREDNCNCDGYTNSVFTISISSATQGGYKPWYLEECSSTLASTYSSGTPSHDAGITTVDQDEKLRPERLCTSAHTGTSASAPLAAGVCALALEANSELTWRDMQYLIIMASNPVPLLSESGWYVNGVDRYYSHKFGYGLMDAGAMVKAAARWKPLGPQLLYKSQKLYPNRTLRAEALGEVVYATMHIKECPKLGGMKYLEHVQALVSVSGSPRGAMELVLISPSGTRSILLMKRSRDTSDGSFEDWPFLSVHFWGESPLGKWTLEVIRHEEITSSGGKKDGLLKDWQLVFHGTDQSPLAARSSGSTTHDRDSSAVSVEESYDEYDALLNETSHIPEVSISECADKCLKCPRYTYGQSCVETCPNKTFPARGGQCKPCHPKCQSCYGPQRNQCLTCSKPLVFVPESSSCHPTCPHSHFLEADYNICLPCFDSKNCLRCSTASGNCSMCKAGFFLTPDSLCSPYCPSGFYSNSNEQQCSACHAVCENCSGPKASQCVSCKSGTFYHERTCLEDCPPGHYENKELRECSPCFKGCLECPGHPRVCLKCEENWILLESKCFPAIPHSNKSCPQGTFYDSKTRTCSSCHDQCGHCYGRGPDHCLTCKAENPFHHITSCLHTCPHFFTYPEGTSCNHCPHSCRSCTAPNACSLCKPGSLLTADGSCVPKCPAGYFPGRSLRCEPCHRNCKACFGAKHNECISCLKDFVLGPEGSCISRCPDGFLHLQGECRACHGRCKTCYGPKNDNCLTCSQGLYFEKDTCWSCRSGEYFDASERGCKPCHHSCRQCSGPLAHECRSCLHHFAFNRWNGSCVECCGKEATREEDCCECNRAWTLCTAPLRSRGGRKRSSFLEKQFRPESKRKESGVFYVFTASTIALVILVYFVRKSRRLKCLSRIYNHYQGYTKVALDNISDQMYLNTTTDDESNDFDDNNISNSQ